LQVHIEGMIPKKGFLDYGRSAGLGVYSGADGRLSVNAFLSPPHA
jgi:hypothetical protein